MRSSYRRSPRLRPGRTVRVTVLDQTNAGVGSLLDISETGLGILIEGPLCMGTTVHVEVEDHLLVGTIVYCHTCDNGYFRAGVQLLNHVGGPTWEAFLRKWQAYPPPPADLLPEQLTF
jgi:PilZ domain